MTVDPPNRLFRRAIQATTQLRRRAERLAGQMRVRNVMTYSNLAVLGERYGLGEGLSGFELSIFSQNGEDGVIAEIFHRIGTESKYFVEFGVGPGREGNSVLLADVYDWAGLFIEGSPVHYAALEYKYAGCERVSTLHDMVTAENIEQLLAGADVPMGFDLLSIDIDSNDYWVWQAITTYRPRVVICEYNGVIDPTVALTQPYTPEAGWDGSDFFGASLKALTELGIHKGYTLVHTDLTGTNAFFVLNDCADAFADCLPVPARRAVPSFTDFRHRADDTGRTYQVPDPAVRPPRD